jgi:hypothetical protein
MSSVACPFKPVAQRERVEEPHVHRFLCQISLGDGTWVQDCECGHRQRAAKGKHGQVTQVFDDGVVVGGSSLDNVIFLKDERPQRDGGVHFINRWECHS